ncbi:hypothetical protein G6F23_015410 [Rhizopus arrhizus]|nr:hypothetical protein G6F23_015410 [Rhizopus arrhizus]
MTTKHIDTVLQHAGTAPFHPETGTAPVPLPPLRASTVRFETLAALEQAQRTKAAGGRATTYGRMGMDTHAALEEATTR